MYLTWRKGYIWKNKNGESAFWARNIFTALQLRWENNLTTFITKPLVKIGLFYFKIKLFMAQRKMFLSSFFLNKFIAVSFPVSSTIHSFIHSFILYHNRNKYWLSVRQKIISTLSNNATDIFWFLHVQILSVKSKTRTKYIIIPVFFSQQPIKQWSWWWNQASNFLK